MKRHMYIATLLGFCLVAAMPAFAGNLYLTGHDYDFHCAINQGACNAFRIAVQLARQGAPDKTKPVLFVDQGTELATAAAKAAFADQSPPITAHIVWST